MEKNNNTLIWVFTVVIIAFFLLGSFGVGSYGMMGGFGMGFGFIFMLLFWGFIIWIITVLINANRSDKNESDSLTLLKKRYASGEITKKQYEEIRKELNR